MPSPTEDQYAPTTHHVQPPPSIGDTGSLLPLTGFDLGILFAVSAVVVALGLALRRAVDAERADD